MTMIKIPLHRCFTLFTACFLFLAFLLASASTARAELYTSDWLIPGDGLILNDTAQNLQWLNLNMTKDISRSQVEYALSHGGSITLSDGIEHNISGWSIASQTIADQLLLDAGITLNSYNNTRAPIEGLLSKWGTLYSHVYTNYTEWHSRALTTNGSTYSEYLGYRSDGTGFAVYSTNSFLGSDFHDTESGVALQRPAPEPATLTLLGVAATMMLLFRRRENN